MCESRGSMSAPGDTTRAAADGITRSRDESNNSHDTMFRAAHSRRRAGDPTFVSRDTISRPGSTMTRA